MNTYKIIFTRENGSPRDGTRTPKIIVLRDYVVLRIAV